MSMTNKIVRQVEGSGLALLVLLTVIFFVIAGSNAAENTSILSATEARILVYISPIGERLRASGSDILGGHPKPAIKGHLKTGQR